MSRHVAFLRGINVGKAKRVAMADLRKLVEGLGYRDVATLLNSGNVVFTAPASARGDAAARIERGMEQKLGVSARVTVLTAAELEEAVQGNPLRQASENPSRFLVAVLRDAADRSKLTPLTRQKWGVEVLAVGARVAYLWCPERIMDSPLGVAVRRALGDGVTARNWNTMLRLQALACGQPAAPASSPRTRARR